jgi:hypothetical protein
MTISNSIGTVTEGSFGRPATRLTAPVGYNARLFKGGIWMLQMQAYLTVGTGNAALTVVMRGTTAVSFKVEQQGGASTAITHTYVGGALVLQLGTDGASAGNTTAAAAVAYLKAQAGLQADFLDFIAGGTGAGIMVIANTTNFAPVFCWLPGKDVQAGLTQGGRGTEDVDNALGLPQVKYATAEQGIHKLRNDDAGTPIRGILVDCYLMDDDQVSGSTNGSTRSKLGKSIFIDIDGSVFVDEYR